MARFDLKTQKIVLSEDDVEEQCLHLLGLYRLYPLRLQSGRFIPATSEVIQALKRAGVRYRITTVGEVGIPDYVIPRFFLETKSPRGKLEPDQEKKIGELKRFYDLETVVDYGDGVLAAWLEKNIKR